MSPPRVKGESVLLLKFCSTVRTVTLYLFHVLRANYCKKGCIDFIIDHIEFLNKNQIQFIKWYVYPTNWFILYNNVECTVGDVAVGFPPLWYFPKQAWHDTCPTGVKRLLLLHTQSVNLMTNIRLILCKYQPNYNLIFFLQNRFCIQLLVGVLLNIEPALRLLTGDQVSEDTCRKGVRVIYWFSPVRLCSSHQNSVGVTGPQSRGDTSNLLLQLRAAKPDRSIKRNMDPGSEPK